MVTLGSKRIHIAFTDSRGFDLDHRVRRINSTANSLKFKHTKEPLLRKLLAK